MRRFIFCTLFLSLFPAFSSAKAAVFDVDTTTDSVAFTACTAAANDCSLRGAILNSNATPEADTINIPAGTYVIEIIGTGENAAATGDFDISSDVTIVGSGAATTTIDGEDRDRIFDIINTTGSGTRTVSISGVTIEDGTAPTGIAEVGGGVGLRGNNNTSTGTTTLNINDCVIRNNGTPQANGGGLGITKNVSGATPVVTISRTTIAGNTTVGNGGAITNTSSQITVMDSTLSGNSSTASNGGGAIFVSGNGSLLNITNSTISGNSASTAGATGGAIRIPTGTVTVNLLNATIANNTAAAGAGGVNNVSGTLNATNTIIANNSGANVDGTNGLNGTNVTNITANFAGLSTLADNGGPTQTHAIPVTVGPGFPKDAGTNAAAGSLTFDQRGPGFLRIVDSTVDIGAFERQMPTAADVSISGRVMTASGQGIGKAAVLLVGGNGEVRRTLTNLFGYYRFDGVEGGETYIVRVEAKRFRFDQQVITAMDSFSDLNFTALP